jgi:hypothetical protein
MNSGYLIKTGLAVKRCRLSKTIIGILAGKLRS